MSEERNFPPEPVRRHRSPAGQALAVVLVALLVGSIFNAERLDYTARTQPFGWQRTVAMSITGPLAGLSRVTGAASLRRALAGAADNELPPPPTDTDDVKLASEIDDPGGTGSSNGSTNGSSDTPTTSSTTTTTAPLRVPTPDQPVKILVVGDSLMGLMGPAIGKQLDGKPIAVTEDWQISTGLARPDVRNWPASVEQDMATYDPEVVVVGFGGNDNQDMQTDKGRVSVGTKEWQDEYERRVVQILDAIEKPGRTVYWVGLPITTRADIERAAPLMTEAVKNEIAIRPWAHFVDSRAALSKDGKYADYIDGVKVREADGVHPNIAGAERIVAAFKDQLIEERKLNG